MGALVSHAALVLSAWALVSGCGESDRPHVVEDGTGFFGAPWPDDRRTLDGRPDLAGFPLRDEIAIIDDYASQIEDLTGFGTNAPVFVPLSGPLEELPNAKQTADADAPIMLVDVDPTSPERGTIIPVSVTQQARDTEFQRRHMLAIQPIWGFPLRPRTTYALVFEDSILRTRTDWRSNRDWSALDDTLLQLRVDPGQIAYALQFTTQDPVGELARATARIQNDITLPPLDQTVTLVPSFQNYTAYTGTMWLPMWQHGTKPYLIEGGGFVFDEEMMPVLSGWERASFTISVPREVEMPEDGWPVAIYGHGTGGDHLSFVREGSSISPASSLAEAGILGFGVSLPLHGDRAAGLDPALASFNYLNPDSARSCFRQGALDQIYIATLLSRLPHRFETTSDTIRTDPSRVAYMGHSHGGLVGAMAGPFFGEGIKAVFLSGAGGGLSTTLVSRDAGDFDIQEILESALDFSDEDVLDETHPVVALVQTLAEVTDPINYAAYWHRRVPHWPSTPQSVLMTEGLLDLQTPPDTAEALAAAGGLPIIAPTVHLSAAHRLLDNSRDTAPAIHNREGVNGEPVTAGLVQYGDGDHFVIFRDPNAAALYRDFLQTALNGGTPWISEQ